MIRDGGRDYTIRGVHYGATATTSSTTSCRPCRSSRPLDTGRWQARLPRADDPCPSRPGLMALPAREQAEPNRSLEAARRSTPNEPNDISLIYRRDPGERPVRGGHHERFVHGRRLHRSLGRVGARPPRTGPRRTVGGHGSTSRHVRAEGRAAHGPRRRARGGARAPRREADARLPDHPARSTSAAAAHGSRAPGSVYPTLQLLADEGLISAEESNGRKTYSLTEAGRAEAEASADRPAPWQTSSARDSGTVGALPKAGIELAQAAAQVGRTGTPEQVQAGGRRARRRASYALLDPRSGLTSVPLGTSASRRLDARRRQHARPLPADPAVRRAIHRADLVVRARPAAHRPGEGRGARASRAADAHRAALPRARGRPRRPHDQGRPVPVVATRRAAARDHEGARRAAGRGAARAVRRDPARSPRPSWACRSSARTRRSTRHRWPRHPSARRTAPGSRRSTPPTRGSTRSSSRCSDRASRRSSTSTCRRCAASPAGSAACRFVADHVDLPALVEEFARHEPRGDRLPARGAQRRAVRRELRRRPAGRRARGRLGAHDAPRADARRRHGDQDQRPRGPAWRRASTRRRSRRSSRPSCSTSSSATASSTPTRTPATSSSRRSSGATDAVAGRAWTLTFIDFGMMGEVPDGLRRGLQQAPDRGRRARRQAAGRQHP